MELFSELLAEIEQIPVIDIRSGIDPKAPAGANAADVVLEREMLLELETARVPDEVLQADNAKVRLSETISHLPKIRNTTTYWCLAQIFNNLYELPGQPEECDPEAAWVKAETSASDAVWPGTVLGRANVEKVVCGCDWSRKIPESASNFAPLLRLDSLLNEPFSPRVLERLGEVSGQPVYEAADIKKAVGELFSAAESAGTVGASSAFNPQIDFEESNREAADRILSLVLLGQKVDRNDRRALRSFVMDQVLAACREHRMPFQLLIGERRGAPGDKILSAYDQALTPMYAALFSRHSGVRFDVIISNPVLMSEMVIASRAYRNVCISGCGPFMMFPGKLRGSIRERIEMLPVDKMNVFASASTSVEWVYARCRLVRRELAFALADMVREGYLNTGAAVDIARAYLYENPRRIYHLE